MRVINVAKLCPRVIDSAVLRIKSKDTGGSGYANADVALRPFAVQAAALRTADRSRFVGVVLQDATALPDPGAGDLVARAITHIIVDTEKEWGGPARVKVEAFPGLKSGAVLLEFEDVTITRELAARMTSPNPPAVGSTLRLPLRGVAPFDASLVMVVTALQASDAQAVARTLEVTEDPQCWRRTIQERFPGALP
jgi:hypothetical protein